MVAVGDASLPRLDLHKTYRVYRRRWFALATVSSLALSNAMIWVGYTSIAHTVNSFYCDDPGECDVAYWTSQIMVIVGALTGVLGMYITDRHGIKLSSLSGSTVNFLGILIRLLSTTEFVSPHSRKTVHYVGQTIGGLSQSFYLCLAPKVAEFWFPDHQRTLANSIGFIANPIGVMVGSLAPKMIVGMMDSVDHQQTMQLINCLLAVPAALVLAMSFLIEDRPPTPPSPSMESHTSPHFVEGLLKVLRNRSFYVQMVTSGMGTAVGLAIFFACDQMFEEMGYSDVNGYGFALTSAFGCFSTLGLGHLVDKTKKFQETVKACYVATAATAVLINIVLRLSHSTLNLITLLILLVLLGFFSYPTWPLGLELGVETTFPVAEATSSGVLITCGQLQIFGLGYLMKWASEAKVFYSPSLSKNFQWAIDVWTLIAVATAVFAYFALWPKYKRLEFENAKELRRSSSEVPALQSFDA
ncbi:hypothetical protein QR680_005226 [Steinernema hermaphroditum]|uniref:Major facilitator superfamily (MFS) profile domain-containing protein n=1 Tax=Steinernema hermaphroditum TaxID=289476 RepID=A0AA39HR91_9BILA|nr:hypothetical protein QR680_005226 [Steinernema hermaphroditum]